MRRIVCCLLLALETNLTSPAFASEAVFAASVGPATSACDPAARYRAVHIDTLDPKLQHVFEDARRTWLKVLAEHHTTDGRGYFLQRDGNTLVTVHAFDSFTEYDVLRAFRADVGKRIGPAGEKAGQQYDAGDVAITSPHNSEVWSRKQELDYHAPGPALDECHAGYMQMVVEQVRTDDYEAAWNEIRAALTAANYPVGRMTFFSMLGSGRQISLWLAPDRAAFQAAGTALFDRLRSATSDVEISDLVPRTELKSPE
jgi:hypothetical protein